MIFLTVGSALPFDRLVQLVDEAVSGGLIKETVVAQIGAGAYLPSNFEYTRFLERHEFGDVFSRASTIISHAGIGTISAALKAKKPILVMPRLKTHGELVDDHQLLTARKFSEQGHLLAFEDREQLPSVLADLEKFVPVPRHPNVEGIALTVAKFLQMRIGEAKLVGHR